MDKEADDPRRRLLIRLLAAGFFGAGSWSSREVLAQILGSPPVKLPPDRSVYRIAGDVSVDGKRATLETRIRGGARVKTGADSEFVYVVGDSAYLARPNTEIVVETTAPDSVLVTGLRLFAGKVLSVFGSGRPVQMRTTVASIGIRGTGVYLESDPERTYFCTCYGVADVEAAKDPNSRETVTATHHDRPLYILGGQAPGKNIRNAPFINHTDQELMLIETLVGREPPFVFPKGDYAGPRRRY